MLRVVFDVNVVVSAALTPSGVPGQLVRLFLGGGVFQLVFSPFLVEEAMHAFAYPKIRRTLGHDSGQAWFQNIADSSDLVPGWVRVDGRCRDPDDDMVLAAAVEGRADFIVSGDRDLLSLGEHDGIRIVSPRAFLELLSAPR